MRLRPLRLRCHHGRRDPITSNLVVDEEVEEADMTKGPMEEVDMTKGHTEEVDMTKGPMEEVEEADMIKDPTEEAEEADMIKAGEVGAEVAMIGQNKEDVEEAEEKFKVDGQMEVVVIKILATKGMVATEVVVAIKGVTTMQVVATIKGVAIKEVVTKDIKTADIKMVAMIRVEDELQDEEVVAEGVVERVGVKLVVGSAEVDKATTREDSLSNISSKEANNIMHLVFIKVGSILVNNMIVFTTGFIL